MSASKKKGTAGETEVKRIIQAEFTWPVERMPASAKYDLRVGAPGDGGLDVLVTRPDRGQWLATVRMADLFQLVYAASTWYDITPVVNIEVKRYARFALHRIWEAKFGR